MIAVTSDDSTARADESCSYSIGRKNERHDYRSRRRSKGLSGAFPQLFGQEIDTLSKVSLAGITCHHQSLHPFPLSRPINCRARVSNLSSIGRSWALSRRRRNALIADQISGFLIPRSAKYSSNQSQKKDREAA
jgi:hypothetical protein